ncbi:carbonic anhydrase [Peptococcaceae bacterium 1198_IL3148]
MTTLISVNNKSDIYSKYQNTPIAELLEYQNLNKPFEKVDHAKIVVGMCMDNRKSLRIPENFAYVLRSGGGNLRNLEFCVSYAVAVGGVKAIALIGHNYCGMVNLAAKEEKFVNGLVAAGWEYQAAVDHYKHFAPHYEICNELDFLQTETKRLRDRYPKILVAPLMYQLEDNRLYLLDEDR